MENLLIKLNILTVLFLVSITTAKAQLNIQWDTSKITNVDDAIHALSETQRVLGWDDIHGRMDWVYGDVMSDDAVKGGADTADSPLFYELDKYTHTSKNAYIKSTWTELYTGIFRANHIIYALEHNVTDSPLYLSDSTRIKAEARFLRAYFYFRLNMLFNGVPLITEPEAIYERSECNTPRSTATEIWTFIENELQLAIPNLPVKGKEYENANALCNNEYMKSTGVYMITKGATQALLCKAHIFEKEWTEARTLADIIINSGTYQLDTVYGNIHLVEFENGMESIFEVQQFCDPDPNYSYGWGTGDMGTIMNVYILSRASGGWGFNCPTQNLYEEFETGDSRRNYTIARHGQTLQYGLTSYNTKSSPTKYLTRKYVVSSDMINKGNSLSNGPSNIRIIRYADVLLWHAEACAQLGDSVAAETSLMQVRKRAGNTTMAPSRLTITAPAPTHYVEIGPSLLDKIYHERRIELAMEGHRFFDLVRTGRAASALGTLGFVAGKNEYLPIPQDVIDASKGVIVQNPGY